jgi:bifunctional UDP-N-acetylglucosamine pyrophosphorylase/glucosamine-1-phosphate N-acetyltransferase
MDNKTLKKYQDKGITILDPRNTYIGPGVQIAKGNIIYPNTFLIATGKKGQKNGRIKIGQKNILGPNLHVEGSVTIGNNNNISYSHITNSKIGNLNNIGPYSRIRDGAVIGNKVRVGNFVEIKNSAISDGAQIAHLSYIGDATLGKNVNIGAGTITANYNSVSGKKNKTIIKNNASTGSNSVLVAPVTIGEGALIGAGSVITKNVPAKSLGIARSKQENKPF